MIYYISDTHFGHANVIRMCDRPYADIKEMNEDFIARWNGRVTNGDTVYIVGDLFFGKITSAEIVDILTRLKGKKHLILGNHDDSWMRKLKNEHIELIKHLNGNYGFLESINDMLTVNTPFGKAILCHYPLMSFRAKWQIHGHIHGNTDMNYWPLLETMDHSLNASVEINEYRPVTFEELVQNNWSFKESSFAASSAGKQYYTAREAAKEEVEKAGTVSLQKLFMLADMKSVTERYLACVDRPSWATEEELALDASGGRAKRWAELQEKARFRLNLTLRSILKIMPLGDTNAAQRFTICVARLLDDFRDQEDILRDIDSIVVIDDSEMHIRNVNMDKAELFFDVFAVKPDSREHYAVEYTSWKELLSCDVLPRSIKQYGIDAVAAAILYEMTFFGMEENAVERERKKLDVCVSELNNADNTDFTSQADFNNELFERLNDIDDCALEVSCLEEEYTAVARTINQGILKELLSDYERANWKKVPEILA